MIVSERIACRSVISVNLLFAGMSLNKRRTVMLSKHGELLIEMEITYILLHMDNNDGYFLSLFFILEISNIYLPFVQHGLDAQEKNYIGGRSKW